MAGLVRAKRLEWRKLAHDVEIWKAVKGEIAYYVESVNGRVKYQISRGSMSRNAVSIAEAQAACQDDFDARWREMTEVRDLVFDREVFDVDGRICRMATGLDESEYYLWNDGRYELPGSRETLRAGSINHAIAACNAHHTAAVIGES